MKEKIQEYESLRSEIISLEEQQTNVWIYMYVIFCSLFILGLEWSHYLFLTTYVVLIPFQCVINNFIWSISKVSIYICIFFENEYNDLNWEGFHKFYPYRRYHKEKSNQISEIIRSSGAIHLGGLSTSFFFVSILKNSYSNNLFKVGVMDIILMLFAVALFFIILIINK